MKLVLMLKGGHTQNYVEYNVSSQLSDLQLLTSHHIPPG